MGIFRKALSMLEKYALCNHCLGRQFALLGYGLENDERGKTVKMALMFKAHALALSKTEKGVKILRILATNGLFKPADALLEKMGKRVSARVYSEACYLCEDKFEACDDLAKKALSILADYEFSSFLVGTELPVAVAEREDEFKAEFEVDYGESLRNEFGRAIGKIISRNSGKTTEFKKPEIVVLVNPFAGRVAIQVNPLFIAGRYKKTVRGIPQSKWYCSNCRGKGCEKCNWTGKMYKESVQELIEKPLLDATSGTGTFFHASGREDIDARMLGRGRPFVIEVTRPKKRFIDLEELKKAVNAQGRKRVTVSGLRFADKRNVRRLKRGESTQKEYRVLIEFETKILDRDLHVLEESLANAVIRQQTPIRVLHRRADLTREKYIYEANVKKLSPKKAEMKIRCQGGLYVKELVTGDDGRTVPSVSEILQNRAKPLKLDVLNVIMKD